MWESQISTLLSLAITGHGAGLGGLSLVTVTAPPAGQVRSVVTKLDIHNKYFSGWVWFASGGQPLVTGQSRNQG